MSGSARSPDRLGLSLAGGGFRAALFHLGVLRRLAELDLLRRVQVLSTVSGGSIVGALYVLRLKRWLETLRRPLSGREYERLVQEVEEMLCDGIRKNLRTRLFLNPLTTLRVLLTHFSLGQAMARLYERHVYARALDPPPADVAGAAAAPLPRRRFSWRRRRILLSDLRVDLPQIELLGGLDAFNAREMAVNGSVVTRIVLNATTLNSGGRFLFSSVEVGDYYLGHFRIDELPVLLARKELLSNRKLDQLLAQDELPPVTDAKNDRAVVELARWWQQYASKEAAPLPATWAGLAGCFSPGAFPGDLPDAALGALRQAKVAAWYLHFAPEGVTGGRSADEHWQTICAALEDIDPQLSGELDTAVPAGSPERALFLEFLVELYRIRTAEHVSKRFKRDWQALTVGDAVGASACFPPVFPPFAHLGIYDDGCASRLGLTDGGVYDNMGVVALMDEGCTSIIASDTGGLFEEKVEAPSDQLRMSLRIPDILMRAVGGFQRVTLRERRRISRAAEGMEAALANVPDCGAAVDQLDRLHSAHELRQLAYFHMASPRVEAKVGFPALPFPVDAERLAQLRTDLDGFGEVEIAALINHGYDTADRYVRRYFAPGNEQRWKDVHALPPVRCVGGARVNRVIDAGASRFLRAIKVRAPVSMLATLAGLVIVTVLTVDLGWSLTGAWHLLAGTVAAIVGSVDRAVAALPGPVPVALSWLATAIPRVFIPWLGRRLGDPHSLQALAAVAALLFAASWGLPARPRQPRRLVWLHTAWKWTSGFAWNVLWMVWLLPLFIAAAATIVAGIGWVLFFLPWRVRATIQKGDVVAIQEPAIVQPRERAPAAFEAQPH